MDINKAKEILSSLAEGIDPTTGEVLPDDSVCNKGDIVRSFYAILNHLGDETNAKCMPANAGKAWSKQDDDLLTNLYQSGTSKKDICGILQRTEAGIAARLVRLRLIDKRDVFRSRK